MENEPLSTGSNKAFHVKINYLPTHGVLPIQVKPIKVILANELKSVIDELPPGGRVVHQATVFIAGRVVPSAQSQQHLETSFLVRYHPFIKSIVKVCPGVVCFNHQFGVIQDRETVHDVRAQSMVNVLR